MCYNENYGGVFMQLHIAVCEDEENDTDILISLLAGICDELGIVPEIDTFTSGRDFLEAAHEGDYDIAFIDIYLDDINGIDTVRNARTQNPDSCQFVFTTISREHAIDAFNLNASHYLVKPLTKDKVKESVERCLLSHRHMNMNVKMLEIKTGRKRIPLPMDSIIYIEVTNTLCTIHTEQGDYQTYISLNALFESLDKSRFIRAQKSFVVNMEFIDSFFYDHLILKEGTEISLSRNSSPKLKKQYQDFLFRYVRRQGR